MTGFEELMPVIDRVVQPITDRMGRMESKLDQALALKEDVALAAAAQQRTDARLRALEESDAAKTIALAKTDGRNSTINWILALIGAPIVVGLAVAGIAKFAGLV